MNIQETNSSMWIKDINSVDVGFVPLTGIVMDCNLYPDKHNYACCGLHLKVFNRKTEDLSIYDEQAIEIIMKNFSKEKRLGSFGFNPDEKENEYLLFVNSNQTCIDEFEYEYKEVYPVVAIMGHSHRAPNIESIKWLYIMPRYRCFGILDKMIHWKVDSLGHQDKLFIQTPIEKAVEHTVNKCGWSKKETYARYALFNKGDKQ
jgi:hypothetical protein